MRCSSCFTSAWKPSVSFCALMSLDSRVVVCRPRTVRSGPLRFQGEFPPGMRCLYNPQPNPRRRTPMIRSLAILACLAAALPAWSQAQAPTRPQIETRKVEGTDNVYIFRNGNHQSIFVVTKEGVIATDPVAYGRPQGGAQYVAEIRKVTDKPIKYLVYSHHHYDHIAGGQAFKDSGAKIVAHSKAKERLAMLKDPATPLPDEVFDQSRNITL